MRFRDSRLQLVMLAVIMAAFACNRFRSPTEPGDAVQLADGHWSSSQMCVDITASSVAIAAGCGRGTLSRPMVNAQGTFLADGTFNVSFGPQQQNPTPTAAHFTGSVDGDTLTMTITSGNQTYGPYRATRGSTVPCPVACP